MYHDCLFCNCLISQHLRHVPRVRDCEKFTEHYESLAYGYTSLGCDETAVLEKDSLSLIH